MDELKYVIKMLEAQGKQISKIEKILEFQQSKINPVNQKPVSDHVKQIKLESENKNKPKYQINSLYKNGFFKTEKTLGEVFLKLKEDGFNFKTGSIQFALDSSEYLDRIGKKRSHHWIQKYPPN